MRDFTSIDAAFVMAQIAQLRRDHPDLADDADLLADTIEGQTDFENVLTKVVAASLEPKFMAEGLGDYLDVVKSRQERLERKSTLMKALAFGMMKAAGLDKVTLPIATLSIRKGLPSVLIEDIKELPQGFTRTEIVPLKKELLAALTNGDDVPGAKLLTPEPSLTIRSK